MRLAIFCQSWLEALVFTSRLKSPATPPALASPADVLCIRSLPLSPFRSQLLLRSGRSVHFRGGHYGHAPVKLNTVLLGQPKQSLPQIRVLSRFAPATPPTMLLPFFSPTLRYGINDVLGIGGQDNPTGFFECFRAMIQPMISMRLFVVRIYPSESSRR